MKSELKGKAAATAKKASTAAKKAVKDEKVVEEVNAAVETAKEVVGKVAEKAAETTEKLAAKTEKVAEKAEKAVKTAAAKAPAKKAAVKEAVYLQYLGKEINKDDLMKRVKEIWTKELKNKVSDMKSVTLYLKPEENAAYYVINEETTGKIEL